MHPVHPKAAQVLASIEAGYESEERQEARRYIGASMAGTDCLAQMALSLRGFPDVAPDPQLKRVFSAGHHIEDWVVRDLKKKTGLRVWERDDISGKQHRREWLNGHVVCNADGIVVFQDDAKAILEIKSMNDANFTNFVKNGVKASHRKYYRQMTMMMAMFNIEHSLFVSYNKNNSQLHAELVPFDQEEWDMMYVKIQAVLDGQAERVASAPEDWRCKSCFKRGSCWSPTELPPACHLCRHSSASKSGGWMCGKTGKEEEAPCEAFEQFAPTAKV